MPAAYAAAASIESERSWAIAWAALAVLTMSFGTNWILSVGLADIAAEAGGSRAVPSEASSLAWFGSGIGGIVMAQIANRTGMRVTVIFGSLMIALGLAISTVGTSWNLLIGQGLFVGVLGAGSINAPMYIYVGRWFDRRRGSALALISSGTSLAGAIWPPIFERAISGMGWRHSMLCYGAVEILVVVPLALRYFGTPPESFGALPIGDGGAANVQASRRSQNVLFFAISIASVLCCIPMAMPQSHLIAFCGDVGISRSTGAWMLSVLLGSAFLSRQLWGAISDRIGGLGTVLLGSAAQAVAIAAFMLTQDEIGLFTVSAAFGLGFSGIIPAYVLSIRELFPASEAVWRTSTMLLFSYGGMALGGWLGGVVYDHFGSYLPAFAVAVGANILNLIVVGILVWRQRYRATSSHGSLR